MNKKVFKTVIALVMIFLVGLYILKIFFPEQFVLSIENKPLIAIGNYIDNNPWAFYIFGIFTSFLTYWLYLCAVCRRWYLKWYEIITVLIVIGASIGFNFIDINLYTALSYTSFIFLPAIFGARLKETSIAYTVHITSQFLTLSIRNLPMYFTSTNSLTIHVVGAETYLWLLFLLLLFNYKKEDNKQWVGHIHQYTEKTTNERLDKSANSTNKLINSTQKLPLLKKIKQFIKKELTKDTLSNRLRRLKLDIKDFLIYDLWVYIIVIGSIALCSWLFNRWIEGIMFCIAHICIRRVFDKQFHFNCTAYCLTLTLAIAWFAIPVTLPMATSLLSSIPIAFLICFFGFVAQDRVDLLFQVRNLQKYADELLSKINNKDIYAMNEEELYQHCRSRGLSEEDCKIAYFLIIERLKGKELYNAIGYCERQTIRKRKKILDTIK